VSATGYDKKSDPGGIAEPLIQPRKPAKKYIRKLTILAFPGLTNPGLPTILTNVPKIQFGFRNGVAKNDLRFK